MLFTKVNKVPDFAVHFHETTISTRKDNLVQLCFLQEYIRKFIVWVKGRMFLNDERNASLSLC